MRKAFIVSTTLNEILNGIIHKIAYKIEFWLEKLKKFTSTKVEKTIYSKVHNINAEKKLKIKIELIIEEDLSMLVCLK